MPLISGWQLRTVQRLSGFDAGLRLESHNVEDFRREELSSLASKCHKSDIRCQRSLTPSGFDAGLRLKSLNVETFAARS